MKKTYLQPIMEVVKFQTATMLATSVNASGLDGVDYNDLGGNPDGAGAPPIFDKVDVFD